MTWRITGLQRRICLALTGLVTLFVVAYGLIAFRALDEQEDDLVDDVVAAETQRLLERLGQSDRGAADAVLDHGRMELGRALAAWLVVPGRAPRPDDPPAELLALPDGKHLIHHGSGVFHLTLTTVPAGRLLVRFDATRYESFVVRFGLFLAGSGLAFVLLSALLALLLARLVVRPFRRLASQLARWVPGTPTPGEGRSDEETLLLKSFDLASRRMDAMLAREREFLANVKHEIRTPLTGLRTDAEMLGLEPQLSDGGRRRIARMLATVDSMSADVDGLHRLSLAQTDVAETVDLAEAVDAAWASLRHLDPTEAMHLGNQIPPGERRLLSRQALMTVLRNVLRNAIEHVGRGRCTVRFDGRAIDIRDDGPGIDAAVLPEIFDRYFSSRLHDAHADLRSQGGRSDPRPGAQAAPADHLGLGLAIARQAALLQGWKLTAALPPEGGSLFRLELIDATRI